MFGLTRADYTKVRKAAGASFGNVIAGFALLAVNVVTVVGAVLVIFTGPIWMMQIAIAVFVTTTILSTILAVGLLKLLRESETKFEDELISIGDHVSTSVMYYKREKLSYHIEINPDGSANVRLFCQVQCIDGELFRTQHGSSSTEQEMRLPMLSHEAHPEKRGRIRVEGPEAAYGRLNYAVEFNPPLKVGQSASYEVQIPDGCCMFSMSESDLKAKYDRVTDDDAKRGWPGCYENFRHTLPLDTDHLHAHLIYPAGMEFKSVPEAGVRSHTGSITVRRSEEQRVEGAFTSLRMREDGRTEAILDIQNPIYGLMYYVRWIPKQSDNSNVCLEEGS